MHPLLDDSSMIKGLGASAHVGERHHPTNRRWGPSNWATLTLFHVPEPEPYLSELLLLPNLLQSSQAKQRTHQNSKIYWVAALLADLANVHACNGSLEGHGQEDVEPSRNKSIEPYIAQGSLESLPTLNFVLNKHLFVVFWAYWAPSCL